MRATVSLPTRTRRSRQRLAATAGVIAAALTFAGAAHAMTYFTATSSPGTSFTLSNLLFNSFSFGFYDVRFAGQCSSCISATGANNAALGTFNFALQGLPWSYIQDPVLYPNATTRPYSGGSERYEGFGEVDFSGVAGGPSLLSSGIFDVATIFATPGASSATVQFELDPQYFQSGVLNLPQTPLYLQITGSTATPVSLVDLTPNLPTPTWTYNTPMTFDFSVVLTDTPFTPGGGGSGVRGAAPEPAAWALMLVGFAGMGAVLRRRRRTLAVASAV